MISPDGQWIAYFNGFESLMRVNMEGGVPQFICNLPAVAGRLERLCEALHREIEARPDAGAVMVIARRPATSLRPPAPIRRRSPEPVLVSGLGTTLR